MIKNLVLIFLNLFNFRKPRFTDLRYTDVVIEGKAFFLVSWKIERGYQLKIKALRYRSVNRRGSAYAAVPDEVSQVEIVAGNLWRTERREVTLIREQIAMQTDFFPVKQFEDFTLKPTTLSLKTPKLRLPGFRITTRNLNKT